MSLRTQEIIEALGDLLKGRASIVVRPRHPERPITEAGYIVSVEPARRRD